MNVRKQISLFLAVTGVCCLTACGAAPTTVAPTATPTQAVVPTTEPTATPTQAVVPTTEPTATATPEPTATPAPTATATPVPTATATPVPTATATPTPTPIPEPEEPGTAYTVTGPNGETFKINVDDNGKMLTQRYYDAEGKLVGRNVVYYDAQGFLFGIECYNGNQELIGMVSLTYYEDGSVCEVYANAEASNIVAALSIELDSDNTAKAEFVQADRRTMTALMYLQDGTLQYTGIMNYNEAGEETYTAVYDTAGVLVMETTYERREDGSYKEEHNNYIASGNTVSHYICEYDAYGNNTYSVYYDAEGAISNENTTEWEYYANGSVKQYTKTREDNGKTVEHKAYNEQGICIEQSRLMYDVEGNCTGASLAEFYDDGKWKQETNSGKNGIKNMQKYNEQGIRIEDARYFYAEETGALESYRITQYNDSGKEISQKEYDTEGNILTSSEKEYYADGTLKKEIKFENGDVLYVYKRYDEQGVLRESAGQLSTMNDKTIVGFSWRQYDSAGNVEKESEYDADCKLVSVYEYYVNGNTKMYESYFYDTTGNLTDKMQSIFYENEIVKEFNHYNGTEQLMLTTKFSEQGIEIWTESYLYNGNGELQERHVHEYDDNGTEISYIRYDADGNIISSQTN